MWSVIINLVILIGTEWYLIVVLVSPMNKNTEHLFMCSFPSACFLWGNVYSNLLPIKKLVLFAFLLLRFKNSLYILDLHFLSDIDILQLSPSSPFHFLNNVFQKTKYLNFDEIHFIKFSFIICNFYALPKKIFA